MVLGTRDLGKRLGAGSGVNKRADKTGFAAAKVAAAAATATAAAAAKARLMREAGHARRGAWRSSGVRTCGARPVSRLFANASGQAQVLVASGRGGLHHHASCRAVPVPALRGARRAGARTAHRAAAGGGAARDGQARREATRRRRAGSRCGRRLVQRLQLRFHLVEGVGCGGRRGAGARARGRARRWEQARAGEGKRGRARAQGNESGPEQGQGGGRIGRCAAQGLSHCPAIRSEDPETG